MAPRFGQAKGKTNMSLPKITARAQRIVGVEDDPYRIDCGILRAAYEDGSHALLVGGDPIGSIRYQVHYLKDATAVLYLADGTFVTCLERTTSEEEAWLEESMDGRR